MRHNEIIVSLKRSGVIVALVATIGLFGFIFVKLNSFNKTDVVDTTFTDHDIFIHKQDGTLSLYNTKDRKYLANLTVDEQSKNINLNGYRNMHRVAIYNNTLYIASPTSKELLLATYDNNNIKLKNTIKVNGTIENFKVSDNTVYIQYSDSKNVDIFNLETNSLEEKITFKKDTSALEIDDKNIYVATGDDIEIIPRADINSSERTKIHIGAPATYMLKSEDGFLYVGNSFGTEDKTSVLVKIDIQNKNVENILELGKEYPIDMFEKEDYLYVLCKGVTDDILDGISIINKETLEKHGSISTGETPNSMMPTSDGYIYVSHDDGTIVTINAKNNFNIDTTFTINGIRDFILKPE